MTTDLAEAERRIIHQTREQAIADIGAERYSHLVAVFAEAHKNDPGTIGNPLVIEPTNEAELHDAANAALAAGYQPDPACECDGQCKWCAYWGCEACCDSYANGDHGVRATPVAS